MTVVDGVTAAISALCQRRGLTCNVERKVRLVDCHADCVHCHATTAVLHGLIKAHEACALSRNSHAPVRC